MNRSKLVLIAAPLFCGVYGAALAAMDQAYEDYRNPQPSPGARAENPIKRGAHRTGEAIEHGARKVGDAVGKGVRKTGEAIGRGGEKLEEKSAPKP